MFSKNTVLTLGGDKNNIKNVIAPAVGDKVVVACCGAKVEEAWSETNAGRGKSSAQAMLC